MNQKVENLLSLLILNPNLFNETKSLKILKFFLNKQYAQNHFPNLTNYLSRISNTNPLVVFFILDTTNKICILLNGIFYKNNFVILEIYYGFLHNLAKVNTIKNSLEYHNVKINYTLHNRLLNLLLDDVYFFSTSLSRTALTTKVFLIGYNKKLFSISQGQNSIDRSIIDNEIQKLLSIFSSIKSFLGVYFKKEEFTYDLFTNNVKNLDFLHSNYHTKLNYLRNVFNKLFHLKYVDNQLVEEEPTEIEQIEPSETEQIEQIEPFETEQIEKPILITKSYDVSKAQGQITYKSKYIQTNELIINYENKNNLYEYSIENINSYVGTDSTSFTYTIISLDVNELDKNDFIFYLNSLKKEQNLYCYGLHILNAINLYLKKHFNDYSLIFVSKDLIASTLYKIKDKDFLLNVLSMKYEIMEAI